MTKQTRTRRRRGGAGGRVGRPPSADPRAFAVNLRLTKSEWDALQALAADRGLTASAALRALIPAAARRPGPAVPVGSGRAQHGGSR